VFKFNSAWRRNSYQDKPSHEQAEYVRRIREDKNFLAGELLEIATAYALNRPRSRIAVLPRSIVNLLPPGWQVNQWRRIRGLQEWAGCPILLSFRASVLFRKLSFPAQECRNINFYVVHE
jgi:hypothetical protein